MRQCWTTDIVYDCLRDIFEKISTEGCEFDGSRRPVLDALASLSPTEQEHVIHAAKSGFRDQAAMVLIRTIVTRANRMIGLSSVGAAGAGVARLLGMVTGPIV